MTTRPSLTPYREAVDAALADMRTRMATNGPKSPVSDWGDRLTQALLEAVMPVIADGLDAHMSTEDAIRVVVNTFANGLGSAASTLSRGDEGAAARIAPMLAAMIGERARAAIEARDPEHTSMGVADVSSGGRA